MDRARAWYSPPVPRFQRSTDPDRPGGQLLLEDGEPVAFVFWMHDYGERGQTGWFISLLEPDGEPVGEDEPHRLQVAPEVDVLIADRGLDRAAWLAQAETVELVTAHDALHAAERLLEQR
jgi:hypothetical protein